MFDQVTVRRALDLLVDGHTLSEVARRTGVNRSTLRTWRADPDHFLLRPNACPICGDGSVAEQAYAYLLGLYLGDGTITMTPRSVAKLRIFQTARYVDLIAEADAAIAAVLPNKVGHVRKIGCVEITSHSKHWTCLFPQHGPGRKHERPIILADWQQDLVQREAKMFLRGLIHSDGCRVINRVRVRGKEYVYPRYFFTNVSTDILRLFTDACDSLSVHWTQTNARNVAVSRKADVAFLDTFIGPKSLAVHEGAIGYLTGTSVDRETRRAPVRS